MYFQAPVPSDLSDFLVGLQSTLSGFGAKLDAIHSRLESVPVDSPSDRQWFKTGDAAELLGKQEYTVREWCRHGRINARKSEQRRGRHGGWLISRDEIERYRSYGLLSADPTRNAED